MSRGALVAAALVALALAALPAPALGQCPSWKPVVTWNTYLGGGTLPGGGTSTTRTTDKLQGLAVNDKGEVFVTGQTNSVGFPSGTELPATSSAQDAFVARFSADGTRLEWVRVFGGVKDEAGMRVALGNSGEVYVVGTTRSSELLTASGAAKTVLTHQGDADGKDAFLAQLSATGELNWFMFLGGSGEDEGLGLAVSPDNKVYVIGRTTSDLTGLGTRYGVRGDGFDAFVIQVDVSNSTSPRPVWTRLLGSQDDFFGFEADDAAYSVVATADAILVGGIAGSIMLGVSDTVVREKFHRGDDDGFVAKLNPTDSSVVWLTNVGYGNGSTEVHDVLVRSDGGLVTVGATTSTGFITPTSEDDSDLFVLRLDSEGRDAGVKRRFIGRGDDGVGHATLDMRDNLFIVGLVGSAGLALNGFDNAFEPSTDGFVMMLDGALNTRWASYVGGSASSPEWVTALAIDSRGQLTLGGFSSASTSFFSTNAGYERSPRGGDDAFVLRVVMDTTEPVTGSVEAGVTPRGRITATWNGFSDPETSIARYEWAIRTAGGVVRDFQPVDGTTATASELLPQVGTPYFVTVRATNGAGCSAEKSSPEVVLTSPPDSEPDEGPDGTPSGSPLQSPLGWGCGSTGTGGGAEGALALMALTLLVVRRARLLA